MLSKNIDEQNIKKLFEKGLTVSEISQKLDIAPSSVLYWKKKLKFPIFDIKYDWKEIQIAHNKGASYSKLKELFGVSKGAIEKAKERGEFVTKVRKRKNKKEILAVKNACWNRYNAKKKNQIPKNQTKEEVQKIKQFYIDCPKGYEVDHIIPISKGGLHKFSNLQYLTISENRKKSNKIIEG